MLVIVVHSSGDQGPYLAAAVMAATLARASGPFVAITEGGSTRSLFHDVPYSDKGKFHSDLNAARNVNMSEYALK